jgi:hypothetical protein
LENLTFSFVFNFPFGNHSKALNGLNHNDVYMDKLQDSITNDTKLLL